MKANCIHHKWIRFIIINPRTLGESLSNESGFIPDDLVFLISFLEKHLLVSHKLYIIEVSSYRPNASRLASEDNSAFIAFSHLGQSCLLTIFSYKSKFIIIMHNLVRHWECKQIINDYLILIPKIIIVIFILLIFYNNWVSDYIYNYKN